jgi:phage shock protein PspC (stress-responsive transcriptional regulator)
MLSIQAWIVMFCFVISVIFIVIASVLSAAMRAWMASGGWLGIAILLIFTIIQGIWTVWGVDCAVRGEYGWHCGFYAWLVTFLVIVLTIFMLIGPIIAVYVIPKQKQEDAKNKTTTA